MHPFFTTTYLSLFTEQSNCKLKNFSHKVLSEGCYISKTSSFILQLLGNNTIIINFQF